MICQALIRASLSIAMLGMLTNCEIGPQIDHREVSARMRAALTSNSRMLTSEEQDGSNLRLQVSMTNDGPVTLPMSWRHGVPLVSARLNHGTVPFLVDTGSQGCVLEARTALARRVRVLGGDGASMTLGGTTGSENALIGLPDEFALGTWVWRQFPFFVRTHETRVRLNSWERENIGLNLIGTNAIFRSCEYLTLDFPAKRIVFGIGRRFTAPSGKDVWQAPLLLRDGLPYVQLQTNGRMWTALVDSGFNGLVDIDKSTAQHLDLLGKARPTDAMRFGLGAPVKGEPAHFGMVYLTKLDSLGPNMVNIPALIVPQRSKIGCALLRPFRVTLDFGRGLLWLEDTGRKSE